MDAHASSHAPSRKRKRDDSNGETEEGETTARYKRHTGVVRDADQLNSLEDQPYERVSMEEARRGTPPDSSVRVYTDGIFDLFHLGHAEDLMQAKVLFPNTHLIVGVCSDDLAHKLRGFTLMNEEERYDIVTHCCYMDKVVRNAPWTLTQDFLTKHRVCVCCNLLKDHTHKHIIVGNLE
ncbi:choline-phosphate cytidylyltransferase A-like [Ictalurus furcatus]|uniref:choline-phosphate cytidylyltransferase A-like n=1 Tax=Ictalurus furcatus TaxID=66913 RepID=UPI0023508942|nr:choline-phosphate cytidylyltransferase A-like [Ictalurus furcatus]